MVVVVVCLKDPSNQDVTKQNLLDYFHEVKRAQPGIEPGTSRNLWS